ncbi:hypothetical protein [Methylobacterium brachythecii]|uniref:Uncharacterized protein n=1 Tax=Methylobacterium brachythecii TaxID=1176177 RepID=A0A7W6AFP0_9HYPH|nr:hypothetical protein [Methylobacterium brachythecii]MBB3901406.1 hypothetical protein [Methylobacterium brachythecii]GLS42980.1 hypothetical protein GCM10007884_09650 [Methylobacterium brachythecii]
MISRRTLLGAAAVLATISAASAEGGLAERRAITAYQQEKYPALLKAIQDAAGFAVPVEVNWDQLAVSGDAKYYADDGYFGKTIFEPLAAGLKEVGKDDMGRQALKAKLKSIRVRYDEKTSSSNYLGSLKFDGGVLDVNWRPFANTQDFKPRVDAVVQMLEKNL